MSGFRLLAIRPLPDCDETYLKGLDPNGVFSFYSNYRYLNKKGESVKNTDTIEKIVIDKDDSFNIYEDELNETSINISALVGKNGSGKSTLLELFYVTCYAIALEKEIVPDNKYYFDEYLKTSKPYLQNIVNNIQRVQMWLRVEIIYAIDSDFFSISYSENNLIHKHIQGSGNFKNFENRIYKNNSSSIYEGICNELFFYSIATNYSLYGLNTENQGHWLQSLFHKNDGYQTPLVITPMRTKGIININNEFYLAQARLLSNLVNENFTLKNVVNGKKVESINFELDTERFDTVNDVSIDLVYKQYIDKYGLSNEDQFTDEKFFTDIYNALYREKSLRIKKEDIQQVPHFESLTKYILRKLIRISFNYNEYNEFYLLPKESKPIPSLRKFREFLLKLKSDNSHIVLKLRQILNAIRFNIFKNSDEIKWTPENSENKAQYKKFNYRLTTEEFVSRIQEIKEEYPSIDLIELIPIAGYTPSLRIKKNKTKGGHIFESLSSGEQQFAHSLHSIYYHLLNVNSVFKSEEEKIKYNYVNIILDEIELYYHPDFQKNYIKELLSGFKNLKLDYIKGINIIFSSHSPFILSDIPANNILRLQEGAVYKGEDEVKSFGANIHDILADDFFLSNGFMGNFAKEKIDKVIGWLNYKILKNEIKFLEDEIESLKKQKKEVYKLKYKILEDKEKELEKFQNISDVTKEYCKSVIKIIDEPLLKNTLNEMYHIVYPKTEDEKLAEIIALAEKLKIDDLANKLNKKL